MTLSIGRVLDRAVKSLADSGSSRLDAELLMAHVLGFNRTQLYARLPDELAEDRLEDFERLIRERCRGVPVAYLLGIREFYSRTFQVSPAVLVPRPETETLVEHSLQLLGLNALAPAQILDVGTGSGCIAITIALERPGARVVASDIDSEALDQAAANVARHRVGDRVSLIQNDLLDELQVGLFDLIVSNPPYVGTQAGPPADPEVVEFEPSVALFGGPLGTELIDRLIQTAPGKLVEGGYLAMELAPFQAEGVEARMMERGFQDTRIVSDLSGLPRVVSGRWEELS